MLGNGAPGPASLRNMRHCGNMMGKRTQSRRLLVRASSSSGAGQVSKCPVGRLMNEFQTRKLSHQVYDPEPYMSQDYQGSKYRMGMGLTPMKHERLIEIDEEYESDIELRRQLLSSHESTVLHSTPEASAANNELLEILVEYLPERFPDRFEKTTDSKFVNKATGDVWDLQDPELDPLHVCALLVQEDLCLMQTDEHGKLKFVSGAVLFPQRWSLIEKIGMNMNRIHQPVPLYAESISQPVNTFMARLQSKRPYERCNWTISDNVEKFQPLDESDIGQVNQGVNINTRWQSDEPITSENAGVRLHTRMERETLSRFPKTGAILFTIKTYVKPLSRFSNQPEKARLLAKALRTMDPSVVQYKTISAFKPHALEFLDAIAAKHTMNADDYVPA